MEIKITLPNPNTSPDEDFTDARKTQLRKLSLVLKQDQRAKPRPVSAPARCTQTVTVPLVSNYDIDNEYEYIMEKAFAAYTQHCRQDVTMTSLKPQQSNHSPTSTRRDFRLSVARVTDVTSSAQRPRRQRPWSALPDRFDAVKMVAVANSTELSSTPRKALNVQTIQLNDNDVINSRTLIKHENHIRKPRNVKNYPSTVLINRKPVSSPVNGKTQGYVYKPFLSRSLTNCSTPRERNIRRSTGSMSERTFGTSRYTRPNLNPALFVVPPDWVTEAMNIQKLSLSERPFTNNSSCQKPSSGLRRCKSAPPTRMYQTLN